MKEIVTVGMRNEQFVVTSKQVAENFKKRHDHVLRDIESLKDVPKFGEMFFETEISDSYGRPQRAYEMNRDGFSLLAMGFTGKEALSWKLKYIEAFNEMEKAWNTPEQVMARALKIASNEIEKLKSSNQLLLEDNERMKPKEIFADAVTASDTSILMRELAKLIRQNGYDIGEKRLWKWMREHGYILKYSTEPSQKAMEAGLFERIERTIQRGDKPPMVTSTSRVTGKGQVYFVNKILKGE